MSNTTGRKREIKYMYIYIFNKFNPKNKESREKEAWNLRVKIDHKT
jgi:hypothetical protein